MIMDYFFYNSDAKSLIDKTQPRFRILISGNFAASSGNRHFGENFKRLKIGDVLLMYENEVGVVAVGSVLKPWDGISYADPLYYTKEEMIVPANDGAFEYRIMVNWYLDLSLNPITAKHLRQYSIPLPPLAFSKINRRSEVEQMLRKLPPPILPTPVAFDLVVPSPERVESTIYRVLRDTAKALYVKNLHNYQCQVCSHTIELPDGKRYAEAHHIRPLGMPHNGPDIISNILCLCPNHHAELDYGVLAITLPALLNSTIHAVDPQYIDYHNQKIHQQKGK